ncbi:MAG: HAD family phosphatase [Agathobacter sp.]|nr:HAD family phosphatase [Agathobacter sp.]
MAIKNVIFDLGCVLVDFHPDTCMKKLGFSKGAIDAFHANIFPVFWEQCDKYPYEDQEIRALFKERVPGFEKEVDCLWDNLTTITHVYEYSNEWLRTLKEEGYGIYILSNYGKNAFEINSKMYDFLKYADGMVISYQICELKPDRKIYEYLLNTYGLKAEESVFIDDRQINIDGAKRCNIAGILFKDYEQANGELRALLEEKGNGR